MVPWPAAAVLLLLAAAVGPAAGTALSQLIRRLVGDFLSSRGGKLQAPRRMRGAERRHPIYADFWPFNAEAIVITVFSEGSRRQQTSTPVSGPVLPPVESA